ncbi:MAG: putative peptidoglycan glycosyltransferase FtsW [Pseudomonadota bacterium]
MTDMVHGGERGRAAEPLLPRWWRTIDTWSLLSVVALFGCGILLALAASPPLATNNGLDPFHYVYRQLAFGGVALGALIFVSMLSPRDVRRAAVLGFLVAMAALAVLPIFGTDFGKGSVRWFSLGFAALQPSEFVKPGFVIFAAWMLSISGQPGAPPGRALSLAAALVLVLMLALQPDYGQASLIFGAWAVMYFVAGASLALLFGLGALTVGAGVVAYESSDHVARRIDGYLAAEIDPSTQIGFATNAIREGGLFGVGIGEGTVKWSLPDAHTDFIIAVAAEEFGLVLCILILSLFAVIVIRSFVRLIAVRDTFVRLAGTGLAALLGMQALVNLGVAVRLLPAKGMTLPFVSYGGSSLLAAGVTLGMLLALTRERPQHSLSEILGPGR